MPCCAPRYARSRAPVIAKGDKRSPIYLMSGTRTSLLASINDSSSSPALRSSSICFGPVRMTIQRVKLATLNAWPLYCEAVKMCVEWRWGRVPFHSHPSRCPRRVASTARHPSRRATGRTGPRLGCASAEDGKLLATALHARRDGSVVPGVCWVSAIATGRAGWWLQGRT